MRGVWPQGGQVCLTQTGRRIDNLTGSGMDNKVYLNGKIIDAAGAFIPADDRAVLYGDGVFETVRAYRGTPFRLDRHLARMAEACKRLRLDIPVSPADIEGAVGDLLVENGLTGDVDARIRITVTGGPSGGMRGIERPGPSGIFILATRYHPHPESLYRDGISLIVSSIRRNASSPLATIKSSNYMDSLLAKQESVEAGADDAVMLNALGQVAEATSSNIFMVKGEVLITPEVSSGILAGITREAIIELSAELGISCREVTATPEDLTWADESFVTNSMIEVLPVREIAGRPLAHCPGPVTSQLSTAYKRLVEKETG